MSSSLGRTSGHKIVVAGHRVAAAVGHRQSNVSLCDVNVSHCVGDGIDAFFRSVDVVVVGSISGVDDVCVEKVVAGGAQRLIEGRPEVSVAS